MVVSGSVGRVRTRGDLIPIRGRLKDFDGFEDICV